MFLKLHYCGLPIVINMNKVYDFHEQESGSRLHFDNSVAPYGSYGSYDTHKQRSHRHWSKDVDETPEEILNMIRVQEALR